MIQLLIDVKMEELLRLILLACIFFTMSFSKAAELHIVSADFDPYTYATATGGSGAMYEVVQELAKRLGQSPQIEFLPWSRAQVKAQENPNIGILPTARVPERESKYAWIIEILDDPYVFISKKNSKASASRTSAHL